MNLKTYLANSEFGGNLARTEKFERLFSDTFDKNIDTNNKYNNYNNYNEKDYDYDNGELKGKIDPNVLKQFRLIKEMENNKKR